LNEMWISKVSSLGPGGSISPFGQALYTYLCRGFAQISLHWETRQTYSKRSWHFEIALYRRNIQRCFQLQHLKQLANNFDYYFAEYDDPRTGNLWTNNPCIEDVNKWKLNLWKKSLFEMCCGTILLLRHKNEWLSQFWISLENEYPSLSHNAIKML